MHLATDAAYTHVEIAKKYIQLSSIYAAELDLNEQSKHDVNKYFLLDDANFSDFFNSNRYEKYVKVAAKAFNFNLNEYNHCTPFFINTLLTEKIFEKTHLSALDHYLWDFAIAKGLEMTGVESLDDQVRILKSIPTEIQIKSFKDTMSNVSGFRNKLECINEMYKKADIMSLYSSTKKNMGKLRKLMIYDRNKVMTDKIINISNRNSSFFAIGAAHLPGSKGVLTSLKRHGYTIKLVRDN